MEGFIKITKIVNLKNLTSGTAIEDEIIESTIKFLTPSQILRDYELELTNDQREKLLHKEKLYNEISGITFRKMNDEKFIELHRQIYEID